jgi:hypothetical protein
MTKQQDEPTHFKAKADNSTHDTEAKGMRTGYVSPQLRSLGSVASLTAEQNVQFSTFGGS